MSSQPISNTRFYISVVSGLLILSIGSIAIQNKNILEQAANVATLALSIIFQALPFILLGVLASSLIRFFLREEWIVRLAPDNGLGGVIVGSFLGLLFPVCDCGVMPVARSLLRKGVSMHTALAYLLTAPVINPVVIIATALAFQWNWHFVALRVASTFFVGVTTAFLAGYLFTRRDFIGIAWHENMHIHSHEEENTKITLHQLFSHAGDEFFDVGRYLIISAFLAAAIQIWIPKGILLNVAGTPYLAAIAMIILAIAMSLCSEADAFVARVLANQFPLGSVVAFLVIGQIIDLRNIILFGKNFRFSLFLFIAIISLGLTYLLSLSIDLGIITRF